MPSPFGGALDRQDTRLYDASHEYLFFDTSTGMLGIGTTAPSEKLHLEGRVLLGQTTAPGTVTDKLYNVAGDLHWSGYEICDMSGNCASSAAGIGGSGTEGYLARFTSQYEIGDSLIYDTGTYIGIGTTAPGYTIDIAGDINLTGALRFGGTAGALGQVPLSDASGIATWTDLTTSIVTEGTNLYYTDERARAAVSATAPLTYSSATGVFGINQSGTSTDGYLSSTDWNTFNNKLTPALTSGYIFVGNVSNVATGVAMSGDATISNTGELTLSSTGVTANTYGSTTQIPVITVDAKGRITSASNQTISYENPLTFSNGLTRTVDAVALGGALTGNTRLYDASHEYLFFDTSTGMLGIGTTAPSEKTPP
jgi:trimeric autotransporter adhesin